jgi:hypothetical protein
MSVPILALDKVSKRFGWQIFLLERKVVLDQPTGPLE